MAPPPPSTPTRGWGVRAHLSCAELARDERSRRLESRQQQPMEQRRQDEAPRRAPFTPGLRTGPRIELW